jgi:hypothetical protein
LLAPDEDATGGGLSFPRLQPSESCDAGICAPRVGDTSDEIADVPVGAYPIVPPRGLLAADRKAFDVIGDPSQFLENKALICGSRGLGSELPGRDFLL